MNEFAALLVLLILSGLFSGSETALVTLSLARVERQLVNQGRHGAADPSSRNIQHPPPLSYGELDWTNNLPITASALATVVIGGHLAVTAMTGNCPSAASFFLASGESGPRRRTFDAYSDAFPLPIPPSTRTAIIRLIYPPPFAPRPSVPAGFIASRVAEQTPRLPNLN